MKIIGSMCPILSIHRFMFTLMRLVIVWSILCMRFTSNPDPGLSRNTWICYELEAPSIIKICWHLLVLMLPQVAKPDSTSEDLDEVPIHRGGKEMMSFFGRDLLMGEHHGTSVKAGLITTPTVFTVGRSLVNF